MSKAIHDATAQMTVVPRRRFLRWLSAALVIAFLVWLGMSFAQGQIRWEVVAQFMTASVLIKGLGIAMALTLTSMALGLVMGVLSAVMRISENPVTRTVAWFYVWVFRGTPVYLQLLMWFNLALIFPVVVIPGLGNVAMTDLLQPFTAATIALGLNQGAYTSEVVRAGLLSVDEGQREASYALGMTSGQTLRKIVIPQAMRVIIPPIGNEFIGMVKTTSLASAIGVTEILTEAQHIYYVNSRVMELLIVCAVWYLAATTVLNIGQYYIERHYAKGATSRALPPTPVERIKSVFGVRGTAE